MAGRRGQQADNDFDYSELEDPVLYCRISLAKNWKADLAGTYRESERTIALTHKRDARTPRRTIRLQPGKTVRMELSLAEGFFGRFSIKVLNKEADAKSESKRKELIFNYGLTLMQSIVRWGDSPRLARAGNGLTYEALGPARFPDVTVAIEPAEEVEDAKDPRYLPVRLRDLYDLGDYVDAEHLVNPGGFMGRLKADEQQARADFAAAEERQELAMLRGQVDTLTQIITASPELAAKFKAFMAMTGDVEAPVEAKKPVGAGKH